MRQYISDVCPATNGLACFMPDLRFGTMEPTPATSSPTAKPTPNPVDPGSPTRPPSDADVTPSPTVTPETLTVGGQLTLQGRYDTLRQYTKAEGITTDQFGMVCFVDKMLVILVVNA